MHGATLVRLECWFVEGRSARYRCHYPRSRPTQVPAPPLQPPPPGPLGATRRGRRGRSRSTPWGARAAFRGRCLATSIDWTGAAVQRSAGRDWRPHRLGSRSASPHATRAASSAPASAAGRGHDQPTARVTPLTSSSTIAPRPARSCPPPQIHGREMMPVATMRATLRDASWANVPPPGAAASCSVTMLPSHFLRSSNHAGR